MDTEILIIGSGMVGMSLAHQLKKRSISNKITILEKENDIGKHSSGRNSGVIHAGIYYKPGSLKANVCIEGAKMLKSWVKDNELDIYNCGKVITPQDKELDSQLEVLYERGIKNGADVRFINEKEFYDKLPFARTSTGRALWSPNTSVVNPMQVLKKLEAKLKDLDIRILKGESSYLVDEFSKTIQLKNKKRISYKYLFNCGGSNAVEIARNFNAADNYILMPFKGIYWDLKQTSPFSIETNLYPVPDINVPFLGVHFTPSVGSNNKVTIGPTATLALGSENYYGINAIEPLNSIRNISILVSQFLNDKNGMRKYVMDQLPLSFERYMLASARKLIPGIKKEHITISQKVGIRAQLFDKNKKELVDDFLCINLKDSTHILNAISPAFTASFALADLIIKHSKL